MLIRPWNMFCTLLLLLLLPILRGIYNSIPEINHGSRVYSVVAILYLQYVYNVMLIRPWNMFCTLLLLLLLLYNLKPYIITIYADVKLHVTI